MIAETALAIAGDNARLVARPHGVAHVYTGPLTPSGRFVPARRRTVCCTRTRRLHVLPIPQCQSSLSQHPGPRLCARCKACLGRDRDRSRHATSTPCDRAGWIRAYTGTTRADIALALEVALTPAEVDTAAWLSLLLFDPETWDQPFTEHGRPWPPLHKLVCTARGRVHGFPEDVARRAAQADANSEAARELGAARRKAARDEREAEITRVGFNAAVPPRRPMRW